MPIKENSENIDVAILASQAIPNLAKKDKFDKEKISIMTKSAFTYFLQNGLDTSQEFFNTLREFSKDTKDVSEKFISECFKLSEHRRNLNKKERELYINWIKDDNNFTAEQKIQLIDRFNNTDIIIESKRYELLAQVVLATVITTGSTIVINSLLKNNTKLARTVIHSLTLLKFFGRI